MPIRIAVVLSVLLVLSFSLTVDCPGFRSPSTGLPPWEPLAGRDRPVLATRGLCPGGEPVTVSVEFEPCESGGVQDAANEGSGTSACETALERLLAESIATGPLGGATRLTFDPVGPLGLLEELSGSSPITPTRLERGDALEPLELASSSGGDGALDADGRLDPFAAGVGDFVLQNSIEPLQKSRPLGGTLGRLLGLDQPRTVKTGLHQEPLAIPGADACRTRGIRWRVTF